MTTIAEPVRRVYVRGVRGSLGYRVADRVADLPGVDVVIASGDEPVDDESFDVVVEVGIADHDVLGERGESVTVGAEGLLDDARRVGARHLVVVSSAMVYGALANNPIPLTEEAVLRPDPTFVYARQLAAAEAAVEAWRTEEAGRRVLDLDDAIAPAPAVAVEDGRGASAGAARCA